jgi:glycosyltransferase involved in cell wall biosynthesis
VTTEDPPVSSETHPAAGVARSATVDALSGVTILRFGICDRTYPRNRLLVRAFEAAGADLVDIVDSRTFLSRTPSLVARALRRRVDVVLVGFPAHSDVIAAKVVAAATGARVVFDPLVGLHETNIEDRALAELDSFQAKRYRAEDWIACRFADLILLDTDCHISYLSALTGVSRNKFRRVWLGTDDAVMHPMGQIESATRGVFFYGNVTPLHGIDHILGAADLLERWCKPVNFTIVAGGSEIRAIHRQVESRGLHSVRISAAVPYKQLAELIDNSEICLGVFGTTAKAKRVIPNKVFDALAMAKPLITADTPAVREALVDGVHALLCRPGDPESLARSILTLTSDPSLRRSLASEGHRLFQREFSTRALSETLVGAVRDALRR